MSEQYLYRHAGPVIRHALATAAHLSATRHQRRLQDLYLGKCDGLAHALEIMLNAADTQVVPGIAGKNQLPTGAEVGRRAEGLDLALEASAYYHDLAKAEPDVFGSAAEQADNLVTTLRKNGS